MRVHSIPALLLALGMIGFRISVDAFIPGGYLKPKIRNRTTKHDGQNREDSLGDKNTPDDQTIKNESVLEELTPPTINFGIFRGSTSTLFDENPTTISNNGPLDLWKEAKATLPSILTGAWGEDSVGNDNPVGALYNILFVRLPAIGMLGVYLKNLYGGHPLVIDVGYGPFEVSPIVVLFVMVVILGPGPQLKP